LLSLNIWVMSLINNTNKSEPITLPWTAPPHLLFSYWWLRVICMCLLCSVAEETVDPPIINCFLSWLLNEKNASSESRILAASSTVHAGALLQALNLNYYLNINLPNRELSSTDRMEFVIHDPNDTLSSMSGGSTDSFEYDVDEL